MIATLDAPTMVNNYRFDEIELVSIVSRKCRKQAYLDVNSFYALLDLSMTNEKTAAKNRITEISRLTDNWDGNEATAPEIQVIKNSYKMIDALFKIGVDRIDSDDIYPMPYGSVVIEINNKKGLVSVEVGRQSIGFFTDYAEHENFFSNGEDTDFRSIPEDLQKALKILR